MPTFRHIAARPAVRRWGLAILAATAYGTLNYLLRGLTLPGCPMISLRPQIILPVLAGLLWGVGPGILVGLGGNFLGDTLGGYGLKFLHFSLANGISGGLPGLCRLQQGERIDSLRRLVIIFGVVFAASVGGLSLATVLHVLRFPQELLREVAWTFLIPAVLVNQLLYFLLLPLALSLLKRMRSTLDLRLGVLLVYVLVPALVIVYVVAMNLDSVPEHLRTLGVTLAPAVVQRLRALTSLTVFRIVGVATVVVVTLGLGAVLWFFHRLLVPVRRLTEAVQALQSGQWRADILRDQCGRPDEFGALATHVQKMGDRVQERQRELEQQIATLRGQVRSEAVRQEADEITQSDYFKDLQEKTRRLKRGRHEKG